MRHILEIRLDKRFFGFTDIKGQLVDFVVRRYDLTKVKFLDDPLKVEMTNEKMDKTLIFGVERVGLQLEKCDNFDSMLIASKELLSIINSFQEYKIDSVSRLGTRSIIVHSPNSYSFDSLQKKYRDLMFSDVDTFTSTVGAKLMDVGINLDLENSDGRMNISSGPVTKNEIHKKVFEGNSLYKDFPRSAGLFIDIDFYKTLIPKENNLEEEIKNNIQNLENTYSGFISLFS